MANPTKVQARYACSRFGLIAVSSDSKFLYSLNSGNGTIGVFGIQEDGSLINLGEAEAISAKAGFNGIAVF